MGKVVQINVVAVFIHYTYGYGVAVVLPMSQRLVVGVECVTVYVVS